MQLKYLIDLHRKEGFNAIHANMWWGGLFGLMAKKSLKIPVVYDPHDWFFSDVFNFPLYNSDYVEKYCAKKLDATLVTGQRLLQYLSYTDFSHKLYVVPNGVTESLLSVPIDSHQITQLREFYGLSETGNVLLFLGALHFSKGVDILIKSLKAMREDSKLVIIGEGDEKRNLELLARKLGVSDNVIFTGRVPWKNLITLLDISNVCVAPFRFDRYTAWNHPIKILEYSARKKAVIASNLPGISELVKPNETGLLVPPEDTQCLSAGLNYLFRNDFECEKMGLEGQKVIAENFTWHKSASYLKSVYESVCK